MKLQFSVPLRVLRGQRKFQFSVPLRVLRGQKMLMFFLPLRGSTQQRPTHRRPSRRSIPIPQILIQTKKLHVLRAPPCPPWTKSSLPSSASLRALRGQKKLQFSVPLRLPSTSPITPYRPPNNPRRQEIVDKSYTFHPNTRTPPFSPPFPFPLAPNPYPPPFPRPSPALPLAVPRLTPSHPCIKVTFPAAQTMAQSRGNPPPPTAQTSQITG